MEKPLGYKIRFMADKEIIDIFSEILEVAMEAIGLGKEKFWKLLWKVESASMLTAMEPFTHHLS